MSKNRPLPLPDTNRNEVDELRAENARLKAQIAKGGEKYNTTGKQHVPSFIPEGTREELERTGEAVNPFNGEVLTKEDLS